MPSFADNPPPRLPESSAGGLLDVEPLVMAAHAKLNRFRRLASNLFEADDQTQNQTLGHSFRHN